MPRGRLSVGLGHDVEAQGAVDDGGDGEVDAVDLRLQYQS
jgi:hypothetical protein